MLQVRGTGGWALPSLAVVAWGGLRLVLQSHIQPWICMLWRMLQWTCIRACTRDRSPLSVTENAAAIWRDAVNVVVVSTSEGETLRLFQRLPTPNQEQL